MNTPNPKVDGYIRKNKKWQAELRLLRMILLDTPLIEQIKWRVPCYTFESGNVALLGAFKEYCVLSFVKGALLKDPDHVLVKPGENTRSVRVIRFTDAEQIRSRETLIKDYVDQAIELEMAGQKFDFQNSAPMAIPEELQIKLDRHPDLKVTFNLLTPGRRRAYLLYFSAAKQSKTRTARVEKWVPKILEGKGLHD
ncbi:MAG: YdeI/OmpD-associated family protein [Phycisphaerales bacterium]|nr:YdeI/OmpD-associated family protein [Phycisphaerales bacterium]